jgi:hypothetical protein
LPSTRSTEPGTLNGATSPRGVETVISGSWPVAAWIGGSCCWACTANGMPSISRRTVVADAAAFIAPILRWCADALA